MIREDVVEKLTSELCDTLGVNGFFSPLQIRSTVHRYIDMAFQCAVELKCPNKRSIEVVQLTKEGKLVRRWASARLAARGIEKPDGHVHILNVCRGSRYEHTAYGFIWKYLKEYEKEANNCQCV